MSVSQCVIDSWNNMQVFLKKDPSGAIDPATNLPLAYIVDDQTTAICEQFCYNTPGNCATLAGTNTQCERTFGDFIADLGNVSGYYCNIPGMRCDGSITTPIGVFATKLFNLNYTLTNNGFVDAINCSYGESALKPTSEWCTAANMAIPSSSSPNTCWCVSARGVVGNALADGSGYVPGCNCTNNSSVSLGLITHFNNYMRQNNMSFLFGSFASLPQPTNYQSYSCKTVNPPCQSP